MGVTTEEGYVTVFSGMGYWNCKGVDGGKTDSYVSVPFELLKYVLFNLQLINKFFQKILC